MTMNTKSQTNEAPGRALPTKYQQVVELLQRDGGATLEDMSAIATWLPHSTRAFITGLKKKGYAITSGKVEGVRRYRAEQKAV